MAVCVSGAGEQDGKDGKPFMPPGGGTPPAGAGPPPAASMGKLVTPHAGFTEARFLSCGIDTLDLSGYVDWGDGWLPLKRKLDNGKCVAEHADKPVVLQDSSCGPCLVLPRGKPPMFRYHLQTLLHHVFIGIGGDAEPGKTPNVYVSILSRRLWGRGVSNSVGLVKGLIESDLGGRVRALVVSRADLCADFLVPGGLSLDMLRTFGVPEDIQTCDIMQGATLETYYIGSPKASIRARVYDKSKEVLEHHKEWFEDIWKAPLQDVFRVEFQFRPGGQGVRYRFRRGVARRHGRNVGGPDRPVVLPEASR